MTARKPSRGWRDYKRLPAVTRIRMSASAKARQARERLLREAADIGHITARQVELVHAEVGEIESTLNET
jgi:hypothetical protein